MQTIAVGKRPIESWKKRKSPRYAILTSNMVRNVYISYTMKNRLRRRNRSERTRASYDKHEQFCLLRVTHVSVAMVISEGHIRV